MDQTIGRTMFPYCVRKMKDCEDDTWILLNRNYKPVGIVDEYETVDYNESPCGVFKAKISKKVKERLGYIEDEQCLYLFNDGTAPWLSKSNMDAYLECLRILMGIKIFPVDMPDKMDIARQIGPKRGAW